MFKIYMIRQGILGAKSLIEQTGLTDMKNIFFDFHLRLSFVEGYNCFTSRAARLNRPASTKLTMH